MVEAEFESRDNEPLRPCSPFMFSFLLLFRPPFEPWLSQRRGEDVDWGPGDSGISGLRFDFLSRSHSLQELIRQDQSCQGGQWVTEAHPYLGQVPSNAFAYWSKLSHKDLNPQRGSVGVWVSPEA